MSGYERPDWLDTGDNEARVGGAQLQVLKDLVTGHGWRNVKPISDGVGTFAHLMKDDFGNFVIVVVRTTWFWKDKYTSVQAFLPNECATRQCPLVMAFVGELVSYYVFNGDEIRRKNLGFNMRLGVQFVNFERTLGMESDPDHVWDCFDALKKKAFQATLG